MGDYTAQAELVYLFIGVLALWIMMFLLDMVMIMPKVIEALKKRGKR